MSFELLNIKKKASFPLFIFDMDGTLFNTEELSAKAILHALQSLPEISLSALPSLNEVYAATKGRSLEDIAKAYIEKFYAQRVPAIKTWKKNRFKVSYQMKLDALKETYDDFFITSSIKLLKSLQKKGYQVCIVSGALRHEIETNCQHAKIKLETYWGAEDYEHGKPNPEPYQTALKHYKINPEQAIIFEDSVPGVESGKRAGVYVVGLARTKDEENVLLNAGADSVVYELTESCVPWNILTATEHVNSQSESSFCPVVKF